MFPRQFLSVIVIYVITSLSAVAADITGRIVDASGEGLPDAGVRLLAARDSAFVKGRAADIDGRFTFTDVKPGKYILEATYLGYDRATLSISVADKPLSLNDISLKESSRLLKETVVTGVKTPIKVMEDTIEYNADSYKTPPNAVVEDLLKRLPGVEVDSEGKITANGKEVKKILVDGKEFFGDDPKVASKNLPVNMVDKLQVVDRKSDLARLTGVDDGDEETVINLTVKKGMKNGWFGNAEAGYGTDSRYSANFNINRFKDGNQITLLGNFNNINSLGFTDGNGSRFSRFGGNNGIAESQTVGVNFNVGNKEIFRVGGNVLYSHSDRVTKKRERTRYLLEKDPYTRNSQDDTDDRGHNVSADLRMEWKPDSFNTVDFRPQFSFNKNDSDGDSFSVSQGRNSSLNKSTSDGKSYEFSGRLIYNRKFRSRPGRAFSISADYRMSNLREYEDSYVYNRFYRLFDAAGNDSIDYYDQYIDNHTWANTLGGRLTWTEPLGNPAKGHFLNISYQATAKWNNANKTVFDRPVDLGDDFWVYQFDDETYRLPIPLRSGDAYEQVDSLSNRFRNTTIQQDIRIGYQHVTSKYRLDAGLSLVPIRSISDDLMHPEKNISRSVLNFAPYATFRYKFSKQSTINFRYMGRSQQPSMKQLQPVPDYSNPLNIRVGNPNLVPSFTHAIRLRQQYYNPDRQQSIMTMLMLQLTQNSIISKIEYNETTGGRTTTYDNINGVWSLRLMNLFSQPLRNKVFSFNNHVSFSYNRRLGYNSPDRNQYSLNVSNSYMVDESFSLAYRPDNLELELRPRYNFQATRNSIAKLNPTNIHSFGGSFNGTWYTPVGIVLATDLNFNATRGYAAGYNEDTWMWNASISYQFLPGKEATIMLRAYDLLQQKKNITRSVTANAISDTRYNELTRYFMISFTYKFNTFGRRSDGTPDLPDLPSDGRGRHGRPDGPDGPPAPDGRGSRGGSGQRPPMGPPPGGF